MNTLNHLQDFHITARLGEGSFASVYRVVRKANGCEYAMKAIQIDTKSHIELQKVLDEVRILASCQSQHLIAYKESFFDQGSGKLYIIMELASQGDLQMAIKKHKRNSTHFSEKQIWTAINHLAKGLKALHQRKILHRDMKSANVLISREGTYKIADLNVSKILSDRFAETHTGSPYYMSPQIFRGVPYDSKCDIWSLGCLIYEMTSLHYPFQADDISFLKKKIFKGIYEPIPNQYSGELGAIIRRMIEVSPHRRLNCDLILSITGKHLHAKKITRSQPHSKIIEDLEISTDNLSRLNQVLPKPNYEKDGINEFQKNDTQQNALFNLLQVQSKIKNSSQMKAQSSEASLRYNPNKHPFIKKTYMFRPVKFISRPSSAKGPTPTERQRTISDAPSPSRDRRQGKATDRSNGVDKKQLGEICGIPLNRYSRKQLQADLKNDQNPPKIERQSNPKIPKAQRNKIKTSLAPNQLL